MDRPTARPARRLSRRFAAVAAAGLAVMSGCGRGQAPAGAGSGTDELRQAAEATLAAKSFVMHLRVAGHPGSEGETTIVYQAPDRARKDSPDTGVEIAVGQTMYSNMPAGFGQALRTPPEGSFWRYEAPRPDPRPLAQGYLVELHVLADASEVTRTGSTYRYRTGTGEAAVSGDATIENGRIARFTFAPAAGNVVTTFRISDYGSAPSVEPPPVDKVLDPPKLEPCAPDGTPKSGQGACDSTGLNVDWEAEVPLPAPTIKQPSTLQLRPVLAVGVGSCGPAPENPPAGQPASLADPEGTCYTLGPAFLTVRRAEARAVRQPPGVGVAVRLDEADTAVLRRVFPGQVEKQVAMVMFGRVQSAPVVQDPDTDGNIVVAAMDAQDAANVVHSLAR